MIVETVSGHARNRAQTVLESSQQSLVRKAIEEKGITASRLAALSNTSRADVSHFLHGHRSKVGRRQWNRIFRLLVQLGIEKPPEREIPTCRNCGMEYPLVEG